MIGVVEFVVACCRRCCVTVVVVAADVVDDDLTGISAERVLVFVVDRSVHVPVERLK